MNQWLVLAAGPNRAGWSTWAAATGSRVICVNGALGECPAPDVYLCTDPRLIEEYAHHRRRLSCPQIIGHAQLVKLVGSHTIAGERPYNIGTWAIYLALTVYRAEAVHVFGIYGTEDGTSWQTLSIVHGEQRNRDEYRATVNAAAKSETPPEPGEATFRFGRSIKRMMAYNTNAAYCICEMRKMYPHAPIVLHGGGPIASMVAAMDNNLKEAQCSPRS